MSLLKSTACALQARIKPQTRKRIAYLSLTPSGNVGRTPWSAADAHVGLWLRKSGSWGTRADLGVRPTGLEIQGIVGGQGIVGDKALLGSNGLLGGTGALGLK